MQSLTRLLVQIRHNPSAAPWARTLAGRYVDWYITQRVFPRLAEASAQGIGLNQAWAEPGSAAAEILAWYDEQLAQTPRVPGLDWFKVFLIRCTEAEWDRQEGTFEEERVLAAWEGRRAEWWTTGRERVAQGITADHDGLYLVLNGLGAAYRHIYPHR